MESITHWIKTTDQERLCAKTWGQPERPALVLVHGYPDHQGVWEPLIEYLIQDYFIITYDVRGAGESSTPRKVSAYSLAQLSFDLELVTQNLLGERAFYLIAHDWGSIQSWESVTEARFKHKIIAFMSISGPCLDHAGHWFRNQMKQQPIAAIRQLGKSWYIAAFQLPFLAPTVWRIMKPTWWHKTLEYLEQQPHPHLNEKIQKDGRYGVNLYRSNMLPRLCVPRERHAICPVYVLVLTQDKFVSPKLAMAAQNWVEHYHQLELEAAHWAISTHPQFIVDFVKQMVSNEAQHLVTGQHTKEELNND